MAVLDGSAVPACVERRGAKREERGNEQEADRENDDRNEPGTTLEASLPPVDPTAHLHVSVTPLPRTVVGSHTRGLPVSDALTLARDSVAARVLQLIAQLGDVVVVAIDIPIGLPEQGSRAARRMLTSIGC